MRFGFGRVILPCIAGFLHSGLPKHIKSSFNKSLYSRSMSSFSSHELVMDPFCQRQFNDPSYTGTQIFFDEKEFEAKVNEYYTNGTPLVDGYAPFW